VLHVDRLVAMKVWMRPIWPVLSPRRAAHIVLSGARQRTHRGIFHGPATAFTASKSPGWRRQNPLNHVHASFFQLARNAEFSSPVIAAPGPARRRASSVEIINLSVMIKTR